MRGVNVRNLSSAAAVSAIAAGLAVLSSGTIVRADEKPAQPSDSGVRVKDADAGKVELRADTIRLQVDGKPGEPPRIINAEGTEGQPIIIRLQDGEAENPQLANDGQVLRRMQERRRAELGAPAPAQGRILGERPQGPGEPRGAVYNLITRLAAPGKAEKITYLGVGASPAPEVLTHQLHLLVDFGLVVDEVVPGSPADKAGVKKFDLVQKLDDQLLVDLHQLTVLVRSHKPGDSVTLSVIREGKPLTLTAKLDQHEEMAEAEEAQENPGNTAFGARRGGEAQLGLGQRFNEVQIVPAPGQPLPPGGGGWLGAPNPNPNPNPWRKPEAPRQPEGGFKAPAPGSGQANPGASVQPGSARENEVRRLEEELRTLQATAEQLRAQVKARQKEEADAAKSKEQEIKEKAEPDEKK